MKNDLKKIIEAKQIWIYGAGIIGKRVVNILQNTVNEKIKGVVVTKKKTKEFGIDGLKIFELNEIQVVNEDVLFIVAVAPYYHAEIEKSLLEKGYTNYLFLSKELEYDLWKLSPHEFVNRKKHKSKVCFVLCGYKEFLWENVFHRLKKFLPNDIEVCLLSSGIRNSELDKIAEKNDWSYLSSERNSVTLVQNIAVSYFNDAEWIYKMDEDIFITEYAFENLYNVYLDAEKNSVYNVGFVAPLIPINGYGHIQILKRLKMLKDYECKFGKVKCGVHPQKPIESNIDAAMYMWGKDGIPQLDKLNRLFNGSMEYSFCNVRFSIGFILYHRELWDIMHGFSAGIDPDMGVDEVELCEMCMNGSRAIVIAENTVVGHFSFGRQTEEMRKCYEQYSNLFVLEEL